MSALKATMFLFLITVVPIIHAQESPDVVRAPKMKVNLYVSAQNGNDNWTGRLRSPNSDKTDGPLQTLHGARLAVQSVQQQYINMGEPLKHIYVQFEAGTYFLTSTEMFTQADSGTNGTQIIYENYQSDQPVISGGVPVTGWTRVSANGDGVVTWQAPVPHVPFENLYYNGVRLLRPRVAANFVGPITATNGYLGSYLRVAGQVSVPGTDPTYTSEKCPNPDPNNPGNFICNDRFSYNPNDPISANWRNLTAPSSPPTSTCTGNSTSTAPAGDVEIVDFEQYDVAKLRINCIDATNHIIYTTGPTAHAANAQHAGANGFLTGHRYLIENVKDYLGVAGQWFLDQSTWTLTYMGGPTDNPNNAIVIIPQQPQLIIASGLENVTFQGLTFAHDNYVIGPTGYNGSSPVQAALSFQDSSDITFQNNIVKQTGGAGVEFISCTTPSKMDPFNCMNPGMGVVTTGNVIKDSAFYDLGANGIRIAESGQADDTMDNIPNNNMVSNNVVEGYGRVFPGSTGIVQGNARNNTYTHNEVYDGYKGAIHLCFCSANDTQAPITDDNVISYNLVHDLFQGIMNDAGSIYVGVGSPGSKATGTGNKMLNNVVHDVTDASIMDPAGMGNGYGGDGLYVDDFTGDVDIENNLVYRVSGHAISFSGPRPPGFPASTVKNNILAFARLSMVNAYDPYAFMMPVPFAPSPQFFVASDNLFYFDRSDMSSPAFHVQGGCAYAGSTNGVIAPYTDFQLWQHNLYYRTSGTPFDQDMKAFHVQTQDTEVTNCAGEEANAKDWSYYFFEASPSWMSLGEDIGSIVKNPGFKNPLYPHDDYSLPNGSPLKGFTIFNARQAGRINPVIMPPAVAETFITQTYNPTTDY